MDPQGRRALIALALAAIGTVGFVIGLREAVRRIPPERPAAAAGSARDSARGRRSPPRSDEDSNSYPRLR